MKFEKFAKKTGANGKIMKAHGFNFLTSCDVAMIIPDFAVNFYQITKADESLLIGEIFKNFDDDLLKYAELERAIVLEADGGAKSIRRIFRNHDGQEVSISNEAFGMLEKQDKVYADSINVNGMIVNHLVILKNQDIVGVIFQNEF